MASPIPMYVKALNSHNFLVLSPIEGVSGFSGMEWWTGMVEWNSGMDGVASYNHIEYTFVLW